MSILERALGSLVEFDKEPKAQESKLLEKSKGNLPLGEIAQIGGRVINQDIYDRLKKVIDARKTAYTTLLETSEKLKRSIPDDTTRIRASFDLIETGGRSVDSIAQAIDVHIADLDSEHNKFKSTTDAQIVQKSQVPRNQALSLQQQVDADTQQIASYQARIVELQNTIDKNRIDIVSLNNEGDRLEADIRKVYDSFKSTLDILKNELLQQRNLIVNTLRR